MADLNASVITAGKHNVVGSLSTTRRICNRLLNRSLEQLVLVHGDLSQSRHGLTLAYGRNLKIAEFTLSLLTGREKLYKTVNQFGDILDQSSELLLLV